MKTNWKDLAKEHGYYIEDGNGNLRKAYADEEEAKQAYLNRLNAGELEATEEREIVASVMSGIAQDGRRVWAIAEADVGVNLTKLLFESNWKAWWEEEWDSEASVNFVPYQLNV